MTQVASYCTQCGAKLEPTSKYCSNCGRLTPLAAGGGSEMRKDDDRRRYDEYQVGDPVGFVLGQIIKKLDKWNNREEEEDEEEEAK